MLVSKEMFNIPKSELGSEISNLVVYSLPFTMVTLFFVSYAFEILGRGWTIAMSYLTTSILYFFLPRTAPSYGWLMFVRCMIGITMAAPLAHPLIADYVHRDSRGKAIAFCGMGIIVGEIAAISLFKLNTVLSMDFYDSFTVSSILVFIASFYFYYAIKDPNLKHL